MMISTKMSTGEEISKELKRIIRSITQKKQSTSLISAGSYIWSVVDTIRW